ncbi:MAG: glycosyltransferase family 4 protein [Alphaproteobacteria bacterium]
MGYRVIHVGTSLETRGGISAVLKVILGGSEEKLSHIVTHCDGSVLKRIMTFMRGWIALVRSLLSGAPAIYHIHSASYGSWARKSICVLTVRLFRRPMILHMHGGGFKKFYETKVGPLGRVCVRGILRSADAIIVLSPEWAEFFKELAPRVAVVVIPNAVAIPPRLDEAHWSGTHAWRIACLGRLWERKGTWDLLRAFAQLEQSAELSLAGDGEIERARSLAQELGVAERVKLLGWIDAETRAQVLSEAHIFALPSYVEGLPMALLEAMSYGLPVISTPVGGIPTLIKHGVNGILIEPGDVISLQQALRHLMTNPNEAVRLGAAARRTIEERYDAAVFRASLHKLHADLAQARCADSRGLARAKLS